MFITPSAVNLFYSFLSLPRCPSPALCYFNLSVYGKLSVHTSDMFFGPVVQVGATDWFPNVQCWVNALHLYPTGQQLSKSEQQIALGTGQQ